MAIADEDADGGHPSGFPLEEGLEDDISLPFLRGMLPINLHQVTPWQQLTPSTEVHLTEGGKAGETTENARS